MITIHDQLKAACDRAGISMKALCLKAGVSEATIASWKKGDPSTVTTLQKIINVLGPDTLVEMMIQSTNMPGAVDYAHMAKVARLQAEYFERMAGIDCARDAPNMIRSKFRESALNAVTTGHSGKFSK